MDNDERVATHRFYFTLLICSLLVVKASHRLKEGRGKLKGGRKQIEAAQQMTRDGRAQIRRSLIYFALTILAAVFVVVTGIAMLQSCGL